MIRTLTGLLGLASSLGFAAMIATFGVRHAVGIVGSVLLLSIVCVVLVDMLGRARHRITAALRMEDAR